MGTAQYQGYSAPNRVRVWQEDGTSNPPGIQTLGFQKFGAWSISPCACSDAGRTLYSTRNGDSLIWTIDSDAIPGQTIALVLGKNSNRGTASMSVNNGPPVTINSYSATPAHRVIVWQAVLPAGVSTIKLVNTGSGNRTRVDVDAVLALNPPQYGTPAVPE